MEFSSFAGRGVQDIHEVPVQDKLLHEYEAQGRSTISGKSVAKGGVGRLVASGGE